MSSLEIIVVLGAVCLLVGVITGYIVGYRSFLKDIPDSVLLTTGVVLTFVGWLALVSYLGFLIYPPGLVAFGTGLGRFARRIFWPFDEHARESNSPHA